MSSPDCALDVVLFQSSPRRVKMSPEEAPPQIISKSKHAAVSAFGEIDLDFLCWVS
jgi:hypothetical protein